MTNDEHKTNESINGMPVWQLHGVTLTNRRLVLQSDAWIHLSDYGDEGWGLMAPEAQIQSWEKELAEEGITTSPWEEMPYKPYDRDFNWMAATIILLSLLGGPLVIVLGVVLIILYKRNTYVCRNMRIADGLKPLFSHTSIKESHVAPTTVHHTTHYHQ